MEWNKEHTIIALDLYCKVPFNKSSNSNPDIKRIAELLGRSVNSVKMKIGNFGSFDPELKKRGIKGLSGISKLDKETWDEYFNNWDKLAYDAQVLIAKYLNQPIEKIALENDNIVIPIGEEKEVVVKRRINQSFFRNAVLASYSSECCITGMRNERLLEACHIANWAEDKDNRTNPSNGLCMNILMHKAFDDFLLSVTPDYDIMVSERFFLRERNDIPMTEIFRQINGQKITLPTRFYPSKDLLYVRHQKFLEVN